MNLNTIRNEALNTDLHMSNIFLPYTNPSNQYWMAGIKVFNHLTIGYLHQDHWVQLYSFVSGVGSPPSQKKHLIGIRTTEMKLNGRKIETWNSIGNKGREWIPDWAVIWGWKKRGISGTWLGLSISGNGGYRKHPSPFLLSPSQHQYSLTLLMSMLFLPNIGWMRLRWRCG